MNPYFTNLLQRTPASSPPAQVPAVVPPQQPPVPPPQPPVVHPKRRLRNPSQPSAKRKNPKWANAGQLNSNMLTFPTLRHRPNPNPATSAHPHEMLCNVCNLFEPNTTSHYLANWRPAGYRFKAGFKNQLKKSFHKKAAAWQKEGGHEQRSKEKERADEKVEEQI